MMSKLPSRWSAVHLAVSRNSILTFSPICRHWSTSQIPTASYGMGTARFLSVKLYPSGIPASFRRRRREQGARPQHAGHLLDDGDLRQRLGTLVAVHGQRQRAPHALVVPRLL